MGVEESKDKIVLSLNVFREETAPSEHPNTHWFTEFREKFLWGKKAGENYGFFILCHFKYRKLIINDM